jgi:hypothetical protein
MFLKKLLSAFVGFLTAFIILLPFSVWFTIADFRLAPMCRESTKNAEYCWYFDVAETVIRFPASVLETLTPVKFSWGDPDDPGRVYACRYQYHGLKILYQVFFVTRKECQPI